MRSIVAADALAFDVLPTTVANAQTVPTCFGRVPTIVGTHRIDTLVGTDGRDVMLARDGGDRGFAGDGNDFVCGNGGRDVLYGEGGADRIDGGTDFDYQWGDHCAACAEGGDGFDTCIVTPRDRVRCEVVKRRG